MLEAGRQDSFEHVPALDDARSVSHICCIQQENCQMHTQNNGMCILIKDPATYSRFYGIDNERLSCQWFRPMLYSIPQVAWNLLPSLNSHHKGKLGWCSQCMSNTVYSTNECIVTVMLHLDKQADGKQDKNILQPRIEC